MPEKGCGSYINRGKAPGMAGGDVGVVRGSGTHVRSPPNRKESITFYSEGREAKCEKGSKKDTGDRVQALPDARKRIRAGAGMGLETASEEVGEDIGLPQEHVR